MEESYVHSDYYQKKLAEAEAKHPDLEDRFCWKCGAPLVRNSQNWHEGFHFDGCE